MQQDAKYNACSCMHFCPLGVIVAQAKLMHKNAFFLFSFVECKSNRKAQNKIKIN
jgi:hypothetical protein